VCADAIQWITQEKKGVWRSLHYHTSREGVLRRVKGLSGWEALLDLPDHFPAAGTVYRPARSPEPVSLATSIPPDPGTGSVRGLDAATGLEAATLEQEIIDGDGGSENPSLPQPQEADPPSASDEKEDPSAP
jgi:hypothetical protein